MVEEWEPSNELQDLKPLGLSEFSIQDYSPSNVISCLFLHLAFVDWHVTLERMNAKIDDNNNNKKARVKRFSEEEFLIALGLLIGSIEYGTRGKDLWVTSSHKDGYKDGEDEKWESLITHPNFDQHMRSYRFRDFHKFFPLVFVDESKKDSDPWYCFSSAVNEFNELRSKRVNGHAWKTADESMSAYRPRTTKLGGLPNISFVLRKPEPLGRFSPFLLLAFHNL